MERRTRLRMFAALCAVIAIAAVSFGAPRVRDAVDGVDDEVALDTPGEYQQPADDAPVSGINGVAWDAVELPSQFMENFCWQAESLAFISGHYQTGEPLPPEMLAKLLSAKNFQAAMMMVRQLEFGLFDFRLHVDYDPERDNQVQETLDNVRDEVAVVKPPAEYAFQHGFSHIFGGGYAAGYYSYKWAEVLSADAFGKFIEDGIFNRQTGEEFLSTILEKGGSEDALDLFIAFRGREPEVDALLRQEGILS